MVPKGTGRLLFPLKVVQHKVFKAWQELIARLPGKDVSTEHASNDVPKMRYIIHIGQSAGYKNVLFAFYGEAVTKK